MAWSLREVPSGKEKAYTFRSTGFNLLTSRGCATERDSRREFACALLCDWLKDDDCDPLGTKPDLERMRCAYVTETQR